MLPTVGGSDYSDMAHRLSAVDFAELHDLYDQTLVEEDEESLHGRLVSWNPTTPNIIRIPSQYVTATPENIFNWEKFNYMYNAILNRDAAFETPYGHVSIINLVDVAETNKAEQEGSFERDYNLEEPWTTGDEDWDQVIVGWYFQDIAVLDKEIQEAHQKYEASYREPEARAEFDDALLDVDSRLEEFIGFDREGLDQLLFDVDLEVEGTILDKVTALVEHIRQQESGDLGEVEITLRDGNHRAFAAIAAGEPYIYASALGLREHQQDPERWAKIEPLLVFPS